MRTRSGAAGHDDGTAAEAEEDADDEGRRVVFSAISSCLIGPGQPRVLSQSPSAWQRRSLHLLTCQASHTHRLAWATCLHVCSDVLEVIWIPNHVLASPQAASSNACLLCSNSAPIRN